MECLVKMLGVRREGTQRRQVQKSRGGRENLPCAKIIYGADSVG